MSLLWTLRRVPLPARKLRTSAGNQKRNPAGNAATDGEAGSGSRNTGTSIATLELPQPLPFQGADGARFRSRIFQDGVSPATGHRAMPDQLAADQSSHRGPLADWP